MNYHAHIPGALAMAGGVVAVAGAPLYFSYFLGAAVGGALPDADIEGSAVEKLGSKAGQIIRKTVNKSSSKGLKKAAAITELIGRGFDRFVLKPITKGWMWFAKGPYYKVYKALYDTIGKKLKWAPYTESKVTSHRGGATHSLTFMITTTVFILPFCLLLHVIPFWIGLEVGIFAHLVADACCVSGTKFFFPWKPAIGFSNHSGAKRGDDIRIVPVKLQMATGREQKFKSQPPQKGTPEYKKEKRWARMERGYRRLFKCLAVVLIALCVIGFGPASGKIAFAGQIYPVGATIQENVFHMKPDASKKTTTTQQSSSSVSSTKSQSQSSDSTQLKQKEDGQSGQSAVAQTDMLGVETVPETEGPTSLTYGDLSLSEIPKGIYKLPDESLWVVGVGPVNKENLDKAPYPLTQDEKDDLLAAAAAQRLRPVPSKTSSSSDSSSSGGLISSLIDTIAGGLGDVSGNSSLFGFRGLTPYTSGNATNTTQ